MFVAIGLQHVKVSQFPRSKSQVMDRKLFLQRCEEELSQCVPLFWFCDGKIDCSQGSDEVNCECQHFNMMECTYQPNAELCVPHTWVCQTQDLCHNITIDCNQTSGVENKSFGPKFFCHLNGTEISLDKRCDGLFDCQGGEDEAGCTGV